MLLDLLPASREGGCGLRSGGGSLLIQVPPKLFFIHPSQVDPLGVSVLLAHDVLSGQSDWPPGPHCLPLFELELAETFVLISPGSVYIVLERG